MKKKEIINKSKSKISYKFLKYVMVFVMLFGTITTKGQENYRIVLGLNPVGYWPMDDGAGNSIRDLTSLENNGTIHHVKWMDSLLDFRGGYQWVEIPNHKKYQSQAFSISMWVYTRTNVIGGAYPGKEGMTLFGNAYGGSGFTKYDLYDEQVLLNKSKLFSDDVPYDHRRSGVSICIRRDELVDVISGKKDALGTRANGVGIKIGKWEHIVYTFDSSIPISGDEKWLELLEHRTYRGKTGTGKLYINGQLAQSTNNIVFEPRDKRFLIGSDAVWWLQADQSGSLNGAIHDLIIFDRPISLEEIKTLHKNTRPKIRPEKIKISETNKTIKNTDIQESIEILKNKNISDSKRAKAALLLSEKENVSKYATQVLTEVLEESIEQNGIYLPRVDDILRNAVMRALLNTVPKNEKARYLLGRGLAKPVLKSHDLSEPIFNEVQALMKKKRYMDALEVYQKLELKEIDRRFFSQGDLYRDLRPIEGGNPRAYTGTAEFNGCTYKIGEGIAWHGVEKVSKNEFTNLVEDIASKYPQVANWRSPNDLNLYRIPITKIDSNGNEHTIYLEGKNFIIGTADAKYRGWSIAVDKKGYIHVTGGMHNAPDPNNYIPGSWEKIGLSRDFTDDNYPAIMYWISKYPENIDSFEFVGQRNNPRRIPVPHGMNYMNFVQDRHGKLYIYGRIYVQGIQSWGLYHYNVDSKIWNGIGGFAPDVKKVFPEWTSYHIEMASDWLALPTMRWKNDHPNNVVLAWARQPHFYNYIRGWGIKFDPTNRMHVQVPLFALDEKNQNANRDLYAYSDDEGNTFHRADGTIINLPLTANPGSGNVDMANHYTEHWWNLWISLLKDAGHTILD